MRIEKLHSRRVWDSRGRPTVEAEVTLEGGAMGRAIAPSGASTGTQEALELRDGGSALGGLDIQKALSNIRDRIGPELLGLDAGDQRKIDEALIALDGTAMRRSLGANAMIAVSMAVAHAAAASAGKPLWSHLAGDREVALVPLPEIQIFGGGAHAARRIDIQDLMVMCPGAASASEAFLWTAEIYRAAGRIMEQAGQAPGCG